MRNNFNRELTDDELKALAAENLRRREALFVINDDTQTLQLEQQEYPMDKPHSYATSLQFDVTYYRKDEMPEKYWHKPHIFKTWNFATKDFRMFKGSQALHNYILALPFDQRTLCECILGDCPQKLRLDIDGADVKLTPEDIAQYDAACRNVLSMMFHIPSDRCKIYWCSSTDAVKTSWHVIIDGYYTCDHRVAEKFAMEVCSSLSIRLRLLVDTSIYSSYHTLRLPFNHKPGSVRVKTLPVGAEFRQALVTYVVDCVELSFTLEAINANKDTPPCELEVQVIIDKILAVKPQCFAGVEFKKRKNNLITFERIQRTECPISGRSHGRSTPYIVAYKTFANVKCFGNGCNGHIWIPLTDNQEAQQIANSKLEARQRSEDRISKICKQLYVPPRIGISDGMVDYYRGEPNIYGDHMKPLPDVSTLFVRANMGMGKTQALKRLIRSIEPKTILAGSFRISFTADFAKTMGLESYETICGKIKQSKHPRVIVQMESFPRLEYEEYDLLILDEIESLIKQCFSTTNTRTVVVWRMFEYMIRNATRVICMDAGLTQETIDIISSLRTGNSTALVHNIATPPPSKHMITTIMDAAIDELDRALNAGKQIVIVTTSKKIAKMLQEHINKRYDQSINIYTSDTPDKIRKQDFADVNEAWTTGSVLIYTPTILAGVSFTKRHYDMCFCFWKNTTADVPTCMQMIKRVRDIGDNVYVHYVREVHTPHLPDTPHAVFNYATESMKNIDTLVGQELINIHVDENRRPIIDVKNLQTRTWINYVANLNKSRNWFLSLLIQEIKGIGGVPSPLPIANDAAIANAKKINAEWRKISKTLKEADMQVIVDARDITDEEYNENKANANEVKRYLFRKCYSYTGDIYLAQIKLYGSLQFMDWFTRRRRVSQIQEDSEEIWLKINHGQFHDCVEDKDELDRHRFALWLLSVFDWKLRFGFIAHHISRDTLLKQIIEIHPKLVENFVYNRILFKSSTKQLPKIDGPDYLKNMIAYLNTILYPMYGVQICAKKNTKLYMLWDKFADQFNKDWKINEGAYVRPAQHPNSAVAIYDLTFGTQEDGNNEI